MFLAILAAEKLRGESSVLESRRYVAGDTYSSHDIQNARRQLADSERQTVARSDTKEKRLAERFKEAIEAAQYSRRMEKNTEFDTSSSMGSVSRRRCGT